MKLSELTNIVTQFKAVQGVERDLLKRKSIGTIGWILGLAGAIYQILIPLISEENFNKAINWIKQPEGLPPYQLVGLLVAIIGFGIYFTLKKTSVLLDESKEPFRYTFWIETFEFTIDNSEETPAPSKSNNLNIIRLDLIERLNQRIKRFSLLDEKDLSETAKKALTSHIHINGYYSIREEDNDKWIIHVLPQIRIGPEGSSGTLSQPVKYTINAKDDHLDADRYKQLVEQIYSSIATEVYRQIESDVKDKIKMFPTDFMKAVALYYEAEDFARSNTIDAYDRAIKLYKEAYRYFNIANINVITNFLLRWPLFWRLDVKFMHMKAKVQIGYAKCLIYRRQISALSGRYLNPLFEIRGDLNNVISSLICLHNRINKRWKLICKDDGTRLKDNQQSIRKKNRLSTSMSYLTFPKDSWLRNIFIRPSQALFERQKRILFDAYVVSSLSNYYLGSIKESMEQINDAKAVAPALSERNALYLLATAIIEPELDKKIHLLRQTTEIAPDFEIANYLLANDSNMKFRMNNEIIEERAQSIINEFEKVLKINPGNITSLSSQGYLWWLLERHDEAERKFKEGSQIKAIVSETFIGELNYGLARIAAERGDFNISYELFSEAISADPGVGAYSATTGKFTTTSYYDYIGFAMFDRYHTYKNNVENIMNVLKKVREGVLQNEKGRQFSEKTINAVHSFVLNDFGNACLNYFHRFGDREKLSNAIDVFRQAIKEYPQNKVVYYNLHNACMWRGEEEDREAAIQYIREADRLDPTWSLASITMAQALLRRGREKIMSFLSKAEEEITKADRPLTTFEIKREALEYRVAKSEEKIRNATPKTSSSLYQIQAEIQKHMASARKLFQEAQNESEQHLNTVLYKVERIIKRTKLSSVYEGFEFNVDGHGVDKLLSQKDKIEEGRLDENDVEALKVWAELLSNNVQSNNDMAYHATKELCNYIKDHYYPDSFDINIILREMFKRKKIEHKIEMKLEGVDRSKELSRSAKEIDIYNQSIKPIINNWLDKDPINYASLSWSIDFFDKKKVIAFLKKALIIDPDNAANQNMLGNMYFNDGDYEKSLKFYTKATEINPDIAVYHSNLGGSFRKLGQWGNALKEYQKAIGINSEVALYHAHLGISHGRLGQYDKMVDHCRKAVELRRNTPEKDYGLDYYYEFLAEGYYKAGRLEEFEEYLESSGDLKEEPEKKAVVYNRIGNLLAGANQDNDALSYYEKAIELDNNRPIYECNLGLTYGKLGQWDIAIEHHIRAVELRRNTPDDPSGLDYYYGFLAEGYYNAGRLEEFEELFEASGDLESEREKKAVVYNRIGNLLAGANQDNDALSYYEKAIEYDNKRPIYECNLGLSYGNLSVPNWDEMIKHYWRAIELRRSVPTDPYGLDYYYEFLAEGYYKAGRLEEFEELFEASGDLESEPEKKAVVYNRIGYLLAGANQDNDALSYYEKAIEINNNRPIYECNLGLTYGKLGQWDIAIEHHIRAVELRRNTPDDPSGLDYYYGFLAEGYYNAGRLEEFEELFEASGDLESEPEKKAVVYNQIGNLLARDKREGEAIQYYTRVIKLDGLKPIYECNLGLTYGKLGQWDIAIEHHIRAVELRRNTPDDPSGLDYYYGFLAEGYYNAGRLEEFEELFEASGDLESEPEKKAVVYNRIGNLLAGANQDNDALSYYEKAIELDNNRPIYECNLGLTYGKLGQWDIAIEHRIRAVELRRSAPTDPYGLDYYYEFLSEGYYKAGRLEELEEYLESSGDLKDEPEKKAVVYNRIGNLLFNASREKESIPYYEKAIILAPSVPVYHANLGGSFRKLGQSEAALKQYNEAIRLDPANVEYHANLGTSYAILGKWKEVIKEFTEALEFDDQPLYAYAIGKAYGELGKWEEMIEYCGRAVELRRSAPTDPYGLDYYYDLLAEGYYKAGRLEEFEEYFESSGDLESEPEKKAVICNRIGGLLARANRYEEAIPYGEKAVKLDSSNPGYMCNLGVAYMELGKWEKMISYYRRAVELRRATPEDEHGLDYYYGFLAEGYYKAGRLEEFEEYFESSGDLKDEPEKKAVVYNQIANLLARDKRGQEAIQYYTRVIEFDGRTPIYECNLGLTYENLGRYDEMIEHCRRAIELRRETPTDTYGLDYYYGNLAVGYYKAGRLEEFEEYFESSGDLKDEPEKKAVVYNQIGSLFFNAYNDKESIPYYEKATVLAPSVAVYHANLGGSFKESGQWEEAIKALTEALELDNQPLYAYTIGKAYGKLGKWEEMIEYCKRAVELRRETPEDPSGLDFYYELLAEGYFKANKIAEFKELFEQDSEYDHDKKDGIVLNKAISYLESQLLNYPDNIELKDVIQALKS